MEDIKVGIIGHKENKTTLAELINQNSNNSKKEKVFTRDIYPLVGVSLMARNYYESTSEEKAIMVEEELKLYIAHKLIHCGYFVSDKEAIKAKISELLTMLYVLNDKDEEIVNQITHYVLGLFIELQGYQVIWYIEDDESYIINPTLEEKGDILDKLITHKDTNPITTFNLVFSYYIENCNKKDLTRTRKKEELPKNGE